MSFAFDDTSAGEFEKWRVKFPDNPDGRRSLVIPALRIAQKQAGWITPEICDYIAGLTDTAPIDVWGVATFYTMFSKKPAGRYILHFCTNISCGLSGGEKLAEQACSRLGIKLGETTPDSIFTVQEAECLGDCGNGPVVQVNDRYHEHMTADKLNELIDNLRSEAGGAEHA